MIEGDKRNNESSAIDDDDDYTDNEVIEIPIDGVLDLHTFSPRDLKELVPEYLLVCQQRGIFDVRIIHGKGVGHLRRSVHALLQRSKLVSDFRLDDGSSGGWGATIVRLKDPK